MASEERRGIISSKLIAVSSVVPSLAVLLFVAGCKEGRQEAAAPLPPSTVTVSRPIVREVKEYLGVQRHDRRDLLRHLPDAGLLLRAPGRGRPAGAQEVPGQVIFIGKSEPCCYICGRSFRLG